MSESEVKDSLGNFSELVAAATPTPGGGSVAAHAAELAASLGQMICNISIGKKKYLDVEPRLVEIKGELERLGARLRELVSIDAESFEAVLAAYRLPKETTDEQAARKEAVRSAGRAAVYTPLETAERASEVLGLLAEVGKIGNQNAFSDVTVGAQLASLVVRGAFYNVGVNLEMLEDAEEAGRLRQLMTEMIESARKTADQIEAEMMTKI